MIDKIIEIFENILHQQMLKQMRDEVKVQHRELFKQINDPDKVRQLAITMAEGIAEAATERYKELGGETGGESA